MKEFILKHVVGNCQQEVDIDCLHSSKLLYAILPLQFSVLKLKQLEIPKKWKPI